MSAARLAVLTLLSLVTILMAAFGQSSVPHKAKWKDFLIVSYKHDGSNYAAVITSTQMHKLGKREFISGKMIYAGEQQSLVGTTIWIPVDAAGEPLPGPAGSPVGRSRLRAGSLCRRFRDSVPEPCGSRSSLAKVTRWVEENGLTLHRTKTKIVMHGRTASTFWAAPSAAIFDCRVRRAWPSCKMPSERKQAAPTVTA